MLCTICRLVPVITYEQLETDASFVASKARENIAIIFLCY